MRRSLDNPHAIELVCHFDWSGDLNCLSAAEEGRPNWFPGSRVRSGGMFELIGLARHTFESHSQYSIRGYERGNAQRAARAIRICSSAELLKICQTIRISVRVRNGISRAKVPDFPCVRQTIAIEIGVRTNAEVAAHTEMPACIASRQPHVGGRFHDGHVAEPNPICKDGRSAWRDHDGNSAAAVDNLDLIPPRLCVVEVVEVQ